MAISAASGLSGLSPDELDTFISLVLSPFAEIAALTTFIVGLNATVALAIGAGTPGVFVSIDRAMVYGTVRAFVVGVAPALFLLGSTISVYT